MHLAEATGSPTFLFEDVHSIYLRNGTHLEGEEATQLHDQVWEIFDATSEYSRLHSSAIPADMSLLDWVVKTLDDDPSYSAFTALQKERILQVSRTWGTYVGDSIETQSLRNLWLEDGMEGGIYTLCSCYLEVEALLSADVLILNRYTDDGVNV